MTAPRSWQAGATGLGIGLLAAWLGAPLLDRFLFQVAPRSAVTFGAVALLVATVAAAAAWLTSRRSTAIQPAEVLRAPSSANLRS